MRNAVRVRCSKCYRKVGRRGRPERCESRCTMRIAAAIWYSARVSSRILSRGAAPAVIAPWSRRSRASPTLPAHPSRPSRHPHMAPGNRPGAVSIGRDRDDEHRDFSGFSLWPTKWHASISPVRPPFLKSHLMRTGFRRSTGFERNAAPFAPPLRDSENHQDHYVSVARSPEWSAPCRRYRRRTPRAGSRVRSRSHWR